MSSHGRTCNYVEAGLVSDIGLPHVLQEVPELPALFRLFLELLLQVRTETSFLLQVRIWLLMLLFVV